MGIQITGVGAYVPNKTVTNYDLAKKVDTTHEWIATKTGILERRISVFRIARYFRLTVAVVVTSRCPPVARARRSA